MALRFQCKAAAVAVAGTVFNHGLGKTPDEWKVNLRGPGAGGAVLYVTTVNATSITVASSGAAATGDVFCHVNHTIIQ